MAGNLIVGFAPAATGGGKGVTGFAPAAQASQIPAAFGALLGLMNRSGPSTVEFAVSSDAAPDVVTTGLLDIPLPLDVEFHFETPAETPPDGEALLADLMTALAALDVARGNGEPVPPALAGKLTETLAALAGILGLPLPAEPAIDPIIAAAANPAATTPAPSRGKVAALPAPPADAAPLPESQSRFAPVAGNGGPKAAASVALIIPAANPAATTPAPSRGEVAALPAPPADAETVPAAAPLPATADAPAPGPAIDPASGLGQLVKKITELAPTLQSHAPGLARRLDALAQKLVSGEIGTQTLARLGIDTELGFTDADLEQALQRLMSASSEAKGTPAPQAFAAAALKLPQIIAPPPGTKVPSPPEPGPADTPVAAEAKPGTVTGSAPRLAFEARPSERPDSAAPQPPTRTASGETPKPGVKPDMPVEPNPPAQHTAQAAASTVNAVAGTKAIHAAYQAPVQQINVPQVAFEVVRQFQAGNSRFQIRLDPPELGRIDVKLDVDKNGNVNARMTVERTETLDLMQRDQRALERALAQAGLDSAKTNLEFSLRQNPFAREDGGSGRGNGSPFGGSGEDTPGSVGETPDQAPALYRGSASASGVNLFV
ncbi:MAG: flagellar hook-length control protein FliK [Devosia sp.]|nr:flagellar hook-length control protein FliK [Devosia sp.]